MNKKRIFVAINIPDSLKNSLENYLEPFFKENPVRITDKLGWHVTVVFCGYLHETQITAMEEALEEKVKGFSPFKLEPAAVSFAPDNNPRMVWLKFKNSSEYSKLCGEFSEFADKKMLLPVPHVTLARFEPEYFHRFKKLLPAGGIDVSGESESFTVDSVEIMESHLGPSGAKYSCLKKFNF